MFPRLDCHRYNPYFHGGYNPYPYGYGYNGYGYNPYYSPVYYNYATPFSPLPYYAPITPLQLSYIQNYTY